MAHTLNGHGRIARSDGLKDVGSIPTASTMTKPDFLEKIDREIRVRARHERFHTFEGQVKFGMDVAATGATIVVISPALAVVMSSAATGWRTFAGFAAVGLATVCFGAWMICRPAAHEFVDEEMKKG